MNETERDRILRMVGEGTLRPHEAAHLLAALADEPGPAGKAKGKSDKAAGPLMEVQMERPDGSHYTVRVPPSLVPMLWEITKATVRESARSAAHDTWAGLKTVVRKKTRQVTTNVRGRLTPTRGPAGADGKILTAQAPEIPQAGARWQILNMVQEGRITAADAGRLLQQLDAHVAYQKSISPDSGNLPG